ncbi:transcriptional regulator, TetR family [Leptospira interrogans str. 2003000735]|uniref:Transcriptional regulator, TetR family n=2 Tax=Leptospira interrogans TaxID=173 RepID=A0A829D7A0_LEPIR|nr:TetR/AcrR family transcriptional regulator [Leptospira interrogans]EMY04835.1 transcriptional regulator, TetR family [Leptospira interrogans str. 2002000626]EMY25658.1 transcriptional regulator, TetR family [Leptospira interrogans serovar Australis str. 200703203]EKN90072.1 transcriptional regulator, TetR family [Leptospira interrogans str. 2002000624]EKQ36764.1 transcriptional regulator, TetR family [Leptospira interrogans str. 2002000621]EKQ49332.1 transcriptional regulator, TetR family [
MKISATQAATIRKSILQTGIHLIRQNGPAVGIQEIADKAKIPKGSFYNYFSSKDQFLIEALEEYTQNAILWNDQTLKKGKQKLFYLYEQKVSLEKKFLQDGISCLINVLSQYSSPKQQKLRNKLKLSLNSISKGILNSLLLDPQNYSKEISIHIQVLESSWRGAMLIAKATGDPSYLENFLSVHRKFIKEFL